MWKFFSFVYVVVFLLKLECLTYEEAFSTSSLARFLKNQKNHSLYYATSFNLDGLSQLMKFLHTVVCILVI